MKVLKTGSRVKVGLVSPLLHPRHGGPVTVLSTHASALDAIFDVRVFGICQPDEVSDVRNEFKAVDIFEQAKSNRWNFSYELYRAIDKASENIDILHAHMLWDFTTYACWLISRRRGIPFVITPHGSLINSSRYNSLHKKIYNRVFIKSILKNVSAIQCLTEEEESGLIEFGYAGRSVVIPNSVPDEYFALKRSRTFSQKNLGNLKKGPVVLFLGRIWGEKGLDVLPEAWARVIRRHPDANLIVCGPDYRGYTEILKSDVSRLGINSSFHLIGPRYGRDKIELLRAANLVVLPSIKEANSMTLLEAAASGIPTLFSKGCNMSELARFGGGFEVLRDPVEIARVLNKILDLDDSELEAVGNRARIWAVQNCSSEIVKTRLASLYDDIIMKQGNSYS